MSDKASPFIIAVPSKGRLQESTMAFFKRAGLTIAQGRGARDYRGTLAELPGVEVAFLSAGEITHQLAAGAVHMGVTGEDLVREYIPDAAARVELLTGLGFGHANVVVAVPRSWIDVSTMADLEDVAASFHARRGQRMRVATKYVNLTRRFFAAQGVTDYRIVESQGATEGAPASGAAELIVDITTTGATLRANALKVLDDGVMLRSEANLVAAVGADWTEGCKAAARAILSRIAAEEEARLKRVVTAQVSDARAVAEAATVDPSLAASLPFGVSEGGPLQFVCASAKAPALADWLIARGAEHVGVGALDYMFTARNELFERLAARIG
jgi:ATP phosphoribosyltransferase